MHSRLNRDRLGRYLLAAALAPALILSTGTPAVAATNTLTLTVLNRSGAKVSVTATVVSLDTNQTYRVRSGTKKKLPNGSYAVLTSVATGGTTTLGGKTLKVSGSTKLTVDSRKGKRVNLAVSPAPVDGHRNLSVRICANPDTFADVEAYGDDIYVIPTTSKKVTYAALGSWSDDSSLTDAYAVVHRTAGVPSKPTRTFSRSSLGSVSVMSRRGPAGSNTAQVRAQPVKTTCAAGMSAGLWNTDRPTTTKVWLSPGSWEMESNTWGAGRNGQSPSIGHHTAKRKIAAGKGTTVRFHNAVWGPGSELPGIRNGWMQFMMNEMFNDPYFPTGSSEGGDKATATVSFKGKTVKTKKDRGWEPEMTVLEYKVKKAGWYTLTNKATRHYPEITYPAGMLSTASTVSYRFHTKPNSTALAQVYSLAMFPIGLNSWNRAKAGSTTNVALKLNRISHDPDYKRGKDPKVKSVTAKMSPDGGRTWRTVKVKKIKGTWTLLVPNPASGAVSLRTRATYTSGGYTDVTVYRAYGIA
ncbi:hypothetical protein AB0M36_18830 [Actinoplanes sp. NPDC051346]|uniref:hypothetical protein n=1 Tax=Actinoplanes sp. NPDC051346 TaxID=3155048 RepID=UPI003435633F